MNKLILAEMEELADEMRHKAMLAQEGETTWDELIVLLVTGSDAINELLGTVNAIRFIVNEYDPEEPVFEEQQKIIRAQLTLVDKSGTQ